MQLHPGDKFGRLTVLKLDYIDKLHYKYYLCKCECGTEKAILSSNLTRTRCAIKSCGCFKREKQENAKLPSSITTRFWNKVIKQDNGCWIWTAYTNSDGYGKFKIGKRTCNAHRMAWMLCCGSIPKGMLVLHHCDNPPCVNPDHLYLGTDADNVRDRDNRNRIQHARGIAQGSHKLTDEQVLEIRMLYNDGKYSECDIADKFGVSQSTIGCIINYKTWRHLSECPTEITKRYHGHRHKRGCRATKLLARTQQRL